MKSRLAHRQHRTACIAAVALALALLLADGAHSVPEQPSSRSNESAAMLFNMQTGDADTQHVMPRISGLHGPSAAALQ